jgi:hypothetical protein
LKRKFALATAATALIATAVVLPAQPSNAQRATIPNRLVCTPSVCFQRNPPFNGNVVCRVEEVGLFVDPGNGTKRPRWWYQQNCRAGMR